MSFTVELTERFRRMLKPLAKKQPGLIPSLAPLINSLGVDPQQGVPLGRGCYKIRHALPGGGKSGGVRIVTLVRVRRAEVLLLAIFAKNELENMPPGMLDDILREIGE